MSNSGFTFRRVREELIETLLDLGIKDFRVLDAISQVPRHIFLDEALWSRAYENRSLTIGYKQTISQPYIVARMTELLISHTNGRGKIFENILSIVSRFLSICKRYSSLTFIKSLFFINIFTRDL